MRDAAKRPAIKTLTNLYRTATGDEKTHHRTIDSHYKRLTPRTQTMLADRAKGHSISAIAQANGITRSSAQEAINRGINAIRHAIAEEPRYYKSGRSRTAAHK